MSNNESSSVPDRALRAAQAQGLWRMLQGKPKDEGGEQAKRAERERQAKLTMDDEWASGANTGKSRPVWQSTAPATYLSSRTCLVC